MTMTLHIDHTGTLTNGSAQPGDHLQVIRALLDVCAMLLRERAPAPIPHHAAAVAAPSDDDDQITWEDAEWQ